MKLFPKARVELEVSPGKVEGPPAPFGLSVSNPTGHPLWIFNPSDATNKASLKPQLFPVKGPGKTLRKGPVHSIPSLLGCGQ
jgi:hypothetical protein